MSKVSYYSGGETEDAMTVMAGWISQNKGVKIQWNNGTVVAADMEKNILHIPRLACSSGLDSDALMLLRGSVYHEAGHIDVSKGIDKKDQPKGALHSIWNAIEDRRMERAEAEKHLGCGMAFKWQGDHYNKEIAGKISKGEVEAPLWEALCAMGFVSDGMSPAWKLTPKAKLYFDTAYEEFSKVRNLKNAVESLDLAKVILKILKQVNEDLKDDKPKQEEPPKGKGEKGEKGKGARGDQQKGEGKVGKDSEDDGEPQSGAAKDIDDEEEEFNKGSEGDGEGKESDEESEEGSGKDNDEDGEEGKGGGKAEGEDEGKESEEGKGAGEDAEGKGKAEGGSESVDREGDMSGEEGGDPSGGLEPSGKGSTGEDDNEKKGVVPRSLDEEIAGMTREEFQQEQLDKMFKEIPIEDRAYTSRRDKDVHEIPAEKPTDKRTFKENREMVSVMVSAMTRALEQALRAMAKSHKRPYLRQGKIDKKRLVAIAKGLSREVFFKTREGHELDTAVSIVIDESGSMRRYLDVRLLAIAIGEALNAIHVPFEMFGASTTSGGGWRHPEERDGFTRVNPIHYIHYKFFNEQWSVVRYRIVNSYARMHNVDGEVVEYAAFRVAQRKERRKVVFSLSDGLPEAGHGNDQEMAANLKRVCKRSRKNGIEIYSVSIDTDSPAKLYGQEYSIVVSSALGMGPDTIKFFVKVLTQGGVKV